MTSTTYRWFAGGNQIAKGHDESLKWSMLPIHTKKQIHGQGKARVVQQHTTYGADRRSQAFCQHFESNLNSGAT